MPSQSLQVIMNFITCQHEWVLHCQAGYRCEPPEGFHFENAHYPLSEKEGGTGTVRLWYPDHIVQGALQTLELKRPCIDTRKYKKELEILNEIYPQYVELYNKAYKFCKQYQGENLNNKIHANKTEGGKSVHSSEIAKRLHSEKDEANRSVNAVKGAIKAHSKKDEKGRSLLGVANAERLNSQKDADGKSTIARKNGLKNILNKEKDELGRSVNAVKGAATTHREKNEMGKSVHSTKTVAVLNAQVWESTVDGFRAGAGNVAQHNIRNGWDPKARVRVV